MPLQKVLTRPWLGTNRANGKNVMFMAPNRSTAMRHAVGELKQGSGKAAREQAFKDIDVGEYYGPYLPSDDFFMRHDFGFGQRVFPQARYVRTVFDTRELPDRTLMKGKDFDERFDDIVDWENYSATPAEYGPWVKAEMLRRLRGERPIPYGRENEYGQFDFKDYRYYPGEYRTLDDEEYLDDKYIDFDREIFEGLEESPHWRRDPSSYTLDDWYRWHEDEFPRREW